MEELKNYRVTAEDGKILLKVLLDGAEDPPLLIKEKRSVFAHAIALAAKERYGRRLKVEYDRNTDRLRRVRTAPLVVKIAEKTEKQGQVFALTYSCTISKCGKCIYRFEEKFGYDESTCLFLSVGPAK